MTSIREQRVTGAVSLLVFMLVVAFMGCGRSETAATQTVDDTGTAARDAMAQPEVNDIVPQSMATVLPNNERSWAATIYLSLMRWWWRLCGARSWVGAISLRVVTAESDTSTC